MMVVSHPISSHLFLVLATLASVATACPFIDSHEARHLRTGGDHNPHGLSQRDLLAAVVPVTGLTVNQAIAAAKLDILCIATQDAHRAAEFVRLIFHDCVGGCNGCVDITNPDNFGLEPAIDDLAIVSARYSLTLTTADVWVLAAHTAAEARQPVGGVNYLSFNMTFVGRPSCSNSKGGPLVILPSAHLTTPNLRKFFTTEFAFTDRDTAAIMGVHTLYVVIGGCCCC
jgi:Peroxidase